MSVQRKSHLPGGRNLSFSLTSPPFSSFNFHPYSEATPTYSPSLCDPYEKHLHEHLVAAWNAGAVRDPSCFHVLKLYLRPVESSLRRHVTYLTSASLRLTVNEQSET